MPYKNPTRNAERARERRAAKFARGECAKCPAPAQPGKTRCAPCDSKHRAHDARRDHKGREAARKARGMCGHCGARPPAEGKTRCQRCLDRAKRNYRARVEAGRCPQCGVEHDREATECASCAAKHAARDARLAAERREAGLCGRCGGPNPRNVLAAMCASCSDLLADYKARGIPCADLQDSSGLWSVTSEAGQCFGTWATEGEARAAAWFSRQDGAFVEHDDSDAAAFARIAARDGSLPPWLAER